MGPNSGGYGGGYGGGGYMQPQSYGGGMQRGFGNMGVMGNSAASMDQSQNPWAQSNQTAFNSAFGSPGGVANQTALAGGGGGAPAQWSGDQPANMNRQSYPGAGNPLPSAPGFGGGLRGYGGPNAGDGTASADSISQGSMSPGQHNGPQPWQPPVSPGPTPGARPWPPQYQPPAWGGIPPQNGPQPWNPFQPGAPVSPYGGGQMGSHQFGGGFQRY